MAASDTVTLLACVAAALKLTDDSMRANLAALPAYHRAPDGPVRWKGQRGPRYVRIDARFALDFAGPLVLQGATTTCYCFLLHAAASVVVAASAFAYVRLRGWAKAATAARNPLAGLQGAAPGHDGGARLADAALRAVFENTMASAELLVQVAVAQAAVSAAVLLAMAAFAAALRPRWAIVHNRVMYADARFLRQAATATTASAFPFVCAVLFGRTERCARWRAAAWRVLTLWRPPRA